MLNLFLCQLCKTLQARNMKPDKLGSNDGRKYLDGAACKINVQQDCEKDAQICLIYESEEYNDSGISLFLSCHVCNTLDMLHLLVA